MSPVKKPAAFTIADIANTFWVKAETFKVYDIKINSSDVPLFLTDIMDSDGGKTANFMGEIPMNMVPPDVKRDFSIRLWFDEVTKENPKKLIPDPLVDLLKLSFQYNAVNQEITMMPRAIIAAQCLDGLLSSDKGSFRNFTQAEQIAAVDEYADIAVKAADTLLQKLTTPPKTP